jgi:hypothetical protein
MGNSGEIIAIILVILGGLAPLFYNIYVGFHNKKVKGNWKLSKEQVVADKVAVAQGLNLPPDDLYIMKEIPLWGEFCRWGYLYEKQGDIVIIYDGGQSVTHSISAIKKSRLLKGGSVLQFPTPTKTYIQTTPLTGDIEKQKLLEIHRKIMENKRK